MDLDELRAKYLPCAPEAAEAGWEQWYHQSLEVCIHGPTCKQGAACTVSKEDETRQRDVVLLGMSS